MLKVVDVVNAILEGNNNPDTGQAFTSYPIRVASFPPGMSLECELTIVHSDDGFGPHVLITPKE